MRSARTVRAPGSFVSRAESGTVLLAVLVLVVAVGASSASFIWFMNQQQARAGARLRSAEALAVAEAGVHRAVSILDSLAPDGSPGRRWRPAAYSEIMPVGPFEGRFVLSVADQDDGSVLVTSMGGVAGATRRLRARVHWASPALLAGVYGRGHIRFEGSPSSVFILPYGRGMDDQPWVHIAARLGVWFAGTDLSINNPAVLFDIGPGPVDAPDGVVGAARLSRPAPVRLLLARGAELMLSQERGFRRVDIDQLQAMGLYVDGVVLRPPSLPNLPEVDAAYYQTLAAGNTRNAALNEAAGQYTGDLDLARKRDSLYSRGEFEAVRTYLQTGLRSSRFQGVVYVAGPVTLLDGQGVQIADGALIAEGTVHLGQASSLDITHTAATRALPGVMVLSKGALVISRDAVLRAHGMIYAEGTVEVAAGAHLDVVGALLGGDDVLSLRSVAASIVIRYDPAVISTPGLHVEDDAPPMAWVVAWEELP